MNEEGMNWKEEEQTEELRKWSIDLSAILYAYIEKAHVSNGKFKAFQRVAWLINNQFSIYRNAIVLRRWIKWF